MNKYPAYKDSGIDWIGGIPEHWKLLKVGTHIDLINGYPFNSEYFNHTEGMPLVRIRDITTGFTETYLTGDYPLESVIENEDILIGMDGDFLVRWWQGGKSLLNQRCCCLRPLETVNKRFLFYLLQYPLNVINDLTYYTTVKHLSSFQVKDIRFPYPPTVNEQQAIADFLDEKTALIETLIEKKKRQIDLLKEQRQAVINQAVTKGLDPDVPMKNSGIDWLGEIPEHWEVKKLKFISCVNLSNVDKKSKEDEQKVLLCNYLDVYNNEHITPDLNFMEATASSEQIKNFTLKEGDVLITKDSEDWDDIAVPSYVTQNYEDVLCGYHLAHIRANDTLIDGRYLFRSFCANTINEQFKVSANGITRYGLGKYYIENSLFLLPPKDEQLQIVEHIEKEVEDIKSTIEKAENQIELLQEYRTALISEAVTGKIDVRYEV